VTHDLKKQGCLALKTYKGNAVVMFKEETYDDSMNRIRKHHFTGWYGRLKIRWQTSTINTA
jgi:hypothetical protein